MFKFENIFTCVIYIITALIMIGIGLSNLKSKQPVGFYSGEKPFREEEISDIQAWNKKHGYMWIIYGICIILSGIIGCIIIDSIWCLLPFFGGTILPLIVMIWYHNQLIKQYKK